MPIQSHGFLGGEAEKQRAEILAEYRGVFARLNELNDICHEYLVALQKASRTEPKVWTAAFYIRGLLCFQSIVILSERGLIEDATALCRTLLQVHFRTAAIAQDHTVISRLKATAESLRKKRAQGFESGKLATPTNVSDVDWKIKIAEIDAILDELGRSEAHDKELFVLGKCDTRDYNAYQLFSDSAHVSVTELQKLMKFDTQGHFVGLKYGPHDRQLVAVAIYAAQIMMDILANADKVLAVGLPPNLEQLRNRVVSS
jgi:Family of unknown function (DUF5677)